MNINGMSLLALLAIGGPGGGVEQSRDLERRASVGPNQRVEVLGLRGSEIEFISWDEPAVLVKLQISVSSSDEDWESDYLRDVALEVDSSGDKMVVKFVEPHQKRSSGSWIKKLLTFNWNVSKDIRGKVYVPRKNAFTTDLRYGSVTLDGVQGDVRLNGQSNTVRIKDCPRLVEIDNDYGRTTIVRSGGTLDLSGKSGDVTINDFRGELVVDAPYSTVSIGGVEKTLTLSAKRGTVTVSGVGGNTKIDADYSRVSVSRVAGYLEVSDKSGSVRVRTVEGIQVDAAYSDVEISDVSGKQGTPIVIRGMSGRLSLVRAVGNTKIDNSYSTMELAEIKGNVEVRAQSASIDAQDIVGDWKSQTTYTGVRVKGLKAQSIYVSNSSSEVELDLVVVPSKLEVRNSYGSVEVSLPKGLSAKVKLKADYGSVKTDLPVDVDVMGSGAVAIGTVGGGSGSFVIEAKSGNVRVRER